MTVQFYYHLIFASNFFNHPGFCVNCVAEPFFFVVFCVAFYRPTFGFGFFALSLLAIIFLLFFILTK